MYKRVKTLQTRKGFTHSAVTAVTFTSHLKRSCDTAADSAAASHAAWEKSCCVLRSSAFTGAPVLPNQVLPHVFVIVALVYCGEQLTYAYLG